MHRGLPTRDTYPNCWCPKFLLGPTHRLPLWLTFHLQPLLEVRLIPLVSISSGGQNWYSVAQTTIVNPGVRLSLVKVPTNKDTPVKQDVLRVWWSPSRSQGKRPELPLGEVNSLLYRCIYFSKKCVSSLVTEKGIFSLYLLNQTCYKCINYTCVNYV